MDDILNDRDGEYKYGFTSDIAMEEFPKGLSEEVVRMISARKEEPEWLLDFRLKAFRTWQGMKMPDWAHLNIPEIDFQDITYYAAPKKRDKKSLDEVDHELLKTFDKLVITL
ncbi:MAG: hypothetical protein K2L01_04055 [Rikenellaceae bacterium]|nr:hypothetical protein [Rikenellaceae bacterium]